MKSLSTNSETVIGSITPAPLLVILPGLDGSVELYEEFCNVIAQEQETLVVSYPMDRYLGIDDLVNYAEARIPQDRSILLMGISFSGPIAAQLLARNYRNYLGAVFCTTFVTPPRPLLLKLARLLPLSLLFLTYHVSSLVRFIFFEKESSSDLIRHFQEVNRQLTPSVIAKRVRAVSRVDEREAVKKIDLPCCYLRAEKDRIVPRNAIKPLQRNMEDLDILTVNGPHALLQCRPRQSWEAIKEFLTINNLRSAKPE